MGHFNRMEKTKTARKITEWKPMGIRSNGRPRNIWRDEVLNDLDIKGEEQAIPRQKQESLVRTSVESQNSQGL